MALGGDRYGMDGVDRMLDALGRGQHPADDGDANDPLLTLLYTWRSDVAADPLPAGPSAEDIDDAFSAAKVTRLDSARRARDDRRRPRHGHAWSAAAIAAAAVAAVALGSASIMAYSAGPGDALWGVHKTLFNHDAASVELVADLQRDLDSADAALDAGDTERAAQILDSVSERIDDVESAADRVDLIRRRDQIERDINREQSADSGAVQAPVPAPPVTSTPPSQPPVSPTAPQPSPSVVVPPQTSIPLPPSTPPTTSVPLTSPTVPSTATSTVSRTSEPPVDPLDPEDLMMLRATSEPPPTSDVPTRDATPTGNGGVSGPAVGELDIRSTN